MTIRRIKPGLYRTETWTIERSVLVGALYGGREIHWITYPTDAANDPDFRRDTTRGLSSLPGYASHMSLVDAKAYVNDQEGR